MNLEDGFSYYNDGRLKRDEADTDIYQVRKILRRYTLFYKERRRYKYMSHAAIDAILREFGYAIKGIPKIVFEPTFQFGYGEPPRNPEHPIYTFNAYILTTFFDSFGSVASRGFFEEMDVFYLKRKKWKVINKGICGHFAHSIGSTLE
jgi:hypothetical protein